MRVLIASALILSSLASGVIAAETGTANSATGMSTVTFSPSVATDSKYDYPTLKAFTDRQKRIARPVKSIPRTQYIDYVLYNWIRCDAAWNESCSGAYDLNAPPNWQVCKILYQITSAAGEWG
jgi:hypothetical protein